MGFFHSLETWSGEYDLAGNVSWSGWLTSAAKAHHKSQSETQSKSQEIWSKNPKGIYVSLQQGQ